MLNIGSRLEVFWDDHVIDTEKTTARHQICHPVKQGICHVFDKGLENIAISYPNIIKIGDEYRLYYIAIDGTNDQIKGDIRVCVSKDGINWTYPELGIHPYPETDPKDLPNNIVIPQASDGYLVMYDENPACPPEEKYKAVGCIYIRDENGKETDRQLWYYASSDGYNFTGPYFITRDGYFDSLNILFWHEGKYHLYIRSAHAKRGTDNTAEKGGTRDIRVMFSEDFKTWTAPKEITYLDGRDFQMYTNQIQPYPRAPHIFIGLPTRYCQREDWTENVEQFGSIEAKKAKMEYHKWVGKRIALALTDAMFMVSRDGENFYRYSEAFLTCGLEEKENWFYGDCFFAYRMIEADEQNYYLYMEERHGLYGGKRLAYYKIRKDGFACISAGDKVEEVVTKPLTFEGSDLHLNFSTSAFGSIYVDVLDADGNPIEGATSFEVYGDTVDRRVTFSDGTKFERFAGKPIRLRFRMCEAKLYSMYFK